jgi:hypothetical protein
MGQLIIVLKLLGCHAKDVMHDNVLALRDRKVDT